jgi:hypothetical protein
MAYQTGTGTMDQMIAGLATFALANGWTAPAIPGAKNYWRISMSARDTTDTDAPVRIRDLDFKDSAGASVGIPDTALASSTGSAGGGTPASAFGSLGWRSGVSAYSHWVGGNWTVAVAVEGLSVGFDNITSTLSGQDPLDLCVEWSDDGISWTAFTTFDINGIYPVSPAVNTYDYDPLTWPLTPADGLLFSIANTPGIEDEYGEDFQTLVGGGSQRIYPRRYFLRMGKTLVHATINDELCLWNYMPVSDAVAEWHFFADITVSDHIHCAFRVTMDGEPRWRHWSMGIGDNRGLTHHGFGYMLHDGTNVYDSGSERHRSIAIGHPMSTLSGDDGLENNGMVNNFNSSLWQLLDSGGAGYPFPDDGAWPARGITHNAETWRLRPQTGPNITAGSGVTQFDFRSGGMGGYDQVAMKARVHPVSGYATLGVLPVWANAGNLVDDLCFLMGEIPSMRMVRIDNLSDGGEIAQDVNTWKTFPRLRKTDIDEMAVVTSVTTGPAGWAYKKVI